MKEKEFIQKNQKKWADFEKEVKKNSGDPRVLTNSYIDMMDDLSYSRTHYPNRLVRSYLNGVAQMLSVVIYRSQNQTWKNIKNFWLRDLPLVMFHAQKHLLLAFIIFGGSMAIGIYSCIADPDFASFILSDQYLAMTEANIEKGDPMAVYKDADETGMFLRITTNNIMVSVRTYVLSFFFGIGTLLILVYNGVMVGAFQYFFIERGLFWESFLTIWQHGTIEISSIVLAGTAGLVLAEGVIFPGSYSRLDGLRIAGRKSIMIAVGIIPLFILSGAIEAFITRLTETPDIIRLMSILICFAYMVYYFILYPRRVAKNHNMESMLEMNSLPSSFESFDSNKIYAVPALMAKSIHQWLYKPSNLIKWLLLPSLAISLVATGFKKYFPFGTNEFPNLTFGPYDFYGFGLQPLIFGMIVLWLTFILLGTVQKLHAMHQMVLPTKKLYLKFGGWAFVSAVFFSSLLTNGYAALGLFILQPIMIFMAIMSIEKTSPLAQAFVPSMRLFSSSLMRFLGIMGVVFFSFFAIGMLIDSLLLDLVNSFINLFIPFDSAAKIQIQFFTSLFLNLVIVGALVKVWFLCVGLNYYSILESRFSPTLRSKIDSAFFQKETKDTVNFAQKTYHNE